MTKTKKPGRTATRTLDARELASAVGGYEIGGVTDTDSWTQSVKALLESSPKSLTSGIGGLIG